MQHIHVPSSHSNLDILVFAMLQVTQKGNGENKNFNLINVMFRYVETRYVFRVPLHAKQIHGRI